MARLRRRAYPLQPERVRKGVEYGERGQLQRKPADQKAKDKGKGK